MFIGLSFFIFGNFIFSFNLVNAVIEIILGLYFIGLVYFEDKE